MVSTYKLSLVEGKLKPAKWRRMRMRMMFGVGLMLLDSVATGFPNKTNQENDIKSVVDGILVW